MKKSKSLMISALFLIMVNILITKITVLAQVHVAGQIVMPMDIVSFDTKLFTCTFIHPLTKGDTVAAVGGNDGAWSIDDVPLKVGQNIIKYPMLSIINSHVIFPAELKIKTDIKAGQTIKSDGYQIISVRTIKTGEVISVLWDAESMLSVEVADNTKDKNAIMPFFRVYKDDISENKRLESVEAWRIANKNYKELH